jgi:hypothetical protein
LMASDRNGDAELSIKAHTADPRPRPAIGRSG